MNCSQFKDPVSDMYVVGTVVASWSLTQEVAGLGPFNQKNLVTEFAEFSENIKEKLHYFLSIA